MSGGAQPQQMAPVLLAECGFEERIGGTGGLGGAHPARLSELPMKLLPNRSFALAPIRRNIDGGQAMKGTWATEKGSRWTSVTMKVDAQGHQHSRICSVTKDCRGHFKTKVSGARFRIEVQRQGY